MALPCNATPPHIRQQCVELAREGKRIKEIARIVGRSKATVLKILDAAGIDRTFRTIHDRPDAIHRCAALIRDGIGVTIAIRMTNEEFGISFASSTYRDAMMRHGLYEPGWKPASEPDPEPVPVKDRVRYCDMIIRKKDQRIGIDGEPIPPVSVSAGVEMCA